MIRDFFRCEVIVGALPATLTNGTTADATQVMSDLNWIVNQVNANAAPLSNTALLNANNNFSVAQSGVAASAAAHFPIASQVQNWAFNTLSSTLGTNTITARVSGLALPAYAVGQVFTFVPSQRNTGSATLNIDSLGSAVVKTYGQQMIGQELGSGTAVVRVASISPGMPVLDLINPQIPATRGTFTATLTGCTTSPTVTASYSVTNNVVQIDIPGVTATSNTTACTLTGLPPALSPVSTKFFYAATIDNGSSATSAAASITAGAQTVTLYFSAAGVPTTLFTNSGTKGLGSPLSISYTLS